MRDTPEVERTLIIPHADDAIIGQFRRCGQPLVLVYDYHMLVECLMTRGYDETDAKNWVEVNIEGQWRGPGTPAVMHRIEGEDAE